MDQSKSNAIPSEETKVPQINSSVPKESSNRNPLLCNKGSAKFSSTNQDISNLFLTPLAPPSSKLYSIMEDTKTPITNPSQGNNNRDIPDIDDDLLSNTSEMNSSERFNRLSNIFQLPLFEVHTTMHSLKYNRSATIFDPKKLKRRVKKKLTAEDKEDVKRSRTINGVKRIDAENMVQKLEPRVRDYFTLMSQFKTNYLNHVLNNNKIYFQYASMSKQDLSILNTPEFINDHESKFG